MNNEPPILLDPSESGSFRSRLGEHLVLVLVGVTILIALVFTSIGLVLYNASGTAQLDLSRPDYKGVSELVEKEKPTYVEYPETGPIDESALNQFDELFKKQAENVRSVNPFSGDPLDPDALGLGIPTSE